ncbi:uncharacterized protein LOC143895451 isoform X2 [Temnothorax americanus]|uniref:uncharacterized protein LOC143895451 isoform X2 n=1 Tax=Temnothorax americanus TaxID=1964332 RepID=UPI004068B3B4
MPKPSGNSWEEIRHKRVITYTPECQNCPINSFRQIVITFMTIMLVSGVVFQLTTFITTEYDIDILLHVLTYSVQWLAHTLKYNICCLKIRQMRNVMDQVRCDWAVLNNVQEIKIIKKYSAIGRFIALIATLFVYGSVFIFVMILFLSSFLLQDITSNKNESHLQQFPIRVECFIDQQKYFLPIVLGIGIVGVSGITTALATEMLNMSCAYHACSLFEIASYRIEQAMLKNMMQGIDASPIKKSSKKIICQGIINGFKMYRRAIEFIEIFKVYCAWGYTLILPLGILSLSINLYRFSRLIDVKEYYEMTISFVIVLGHLLYMFSINYIGQKIIDHSSDVFHRTYNVQWYLAPLKVQKLLMLMMQRSMRRCIIVIDGLFIPSFEGFTTLASMSISYFTVIFSLF